MAFYISYINENVSELVSLEDALGGGGNKVGRKIGLHLLCKHPRGTWVALSMKSLEQKDRSELLMIRGLQYF